MKYRLIAQFADGYTYRANRADVSIFDKTRNCYWDILNKLPKLHGQVINIGLTRGRFHKPLISSHVPEGATPIYEVDRQAQFTVDGSRVLKTTEDLAFRIGFRAKDYSYTEEIA